MWSVINFFDPDIILRNKFSIQLIQHRYDTQLSDRCFSKYSQNKVFSAINIFGLGVGLAACLLIVQFVMFELSYDKFLRNLNVRTE